MRRELNHNHFAVLFVVAGCFLLRAIVQGAAEPIPLSELAGLRLLPLLLYTAFAFAVMRFYGGWRFRINEVMREHPLALAIFLGLVIHGAAVVLGGR